MPYQRFTRAQLRQQLRDRWEDTPFFTDDDANIALNHALRVWNALTGYWRQRIVVPGAPDSPLIPIPGTLVQRTQVMFQSRTCGPPVSLAELSYLQPNWWTQRTTDGGNVPTRPTIWAPVGLSLIAIWPAVPVMGGLNASYEVDGIRQTPVLLADGAFVDIGDEELSTLVAYALHVAALKAGPVILQRTEVYRTAFLAAAALRNTRLKSQTWYRNYQRQSWQKAMRPDAIPPVESLTSAKEMQ